MSKYLTTQGEFRAISGANPSHFSGDTNLPVENVTWFAATNYCAQLTVRKHTANLLATAYEYRLPTEAEWEYCCRAGTTTRFSYGDDPGYTQLGNYAWYSENSTNMTHTVGTKLPNPWGLYDMYGNVWEWCSDWFAPYSGGSVTDPHGPTIGSSRILRGAAWDYGPAEIRSAVRGTITAPS